MGVVHARRCPQLFSRFMLTGRVHYAAKTRSECDLAAMSLHLDVVVRSRREL